MVHPAASTCSAAFICYDFFFFFLRKELTRVFLPSLFVLTLSKCSMQIQALY